jgi:cobalt-precorrin 5A hydrolase
MALEEIVSALAIGLGCRRGVPAQAVVDLVQRALERVDGQAQASLFTIAGKETEPALYEAAAVLGLPLIFLPRAALEAHSTGAQTRSERVVALFGVPSVAETAALAGCGAGARLIVPRLSGAGVTCAIARVAEDGK